MQTNNSFKIGDLIEMQLAINEVALGIVVDVDTKRAAALRFPGCAAPIKIHWFEKGATPLATTWQNIDEIELVSRGQQ
jgi:hypothetical protein